MTTAEESRIQRPSNSARWISFGPYYGMFPVDFALEAVSRYTDPGDGILDPFAGRGTAMAASVALGRRALGIEISPVGWLYGHVKLRPASEDAVIRRLEEVARAASQYKTAAKRLPKFYRWCFSPGVRAFLLAVRDCLEWRVDHIDATLAGFILVYLHGKYGQALSNQMRQQKSMAPDYSVRWWKERNQRPPKIDPVTFLAQRIRWRYRWGTLDSPESEMRLGDSATELPKLVERGDNFRLLLTSPPYHGVTSYYYDHWLRYWVLGGPSFPTTKGEGWRKESRQYGKHRYQEMLRSVFSSAAKLMCPKSVIYVRTDAREFTRVVTEEVLRESFPRKRLEVKLSPYRQVTQTALFGDSSQKPGEVDLILG